MCAVRSPRSHVASRTLCMICIMPVLVALTSVASAQQTYVSRFDAYVGYALLDSPHVSLLENGFAMQVGYRPTTWYSVGFDYSLTRGDLMLTPSLLTPALQQQLGAEFGQLAAAGKIPSGYTLVVPAHSTTQTFAAGPQLAYRHFEHLTLFLRPVFAGGIHEVATPRPGDPIAALVVTQLAPSGKKTDTVGFVGFGGGVDVILSKHFALRTQVDLVYDHLFSDLLKDGRFTTRFSVGPAFNFGRNIVK
jgi:hypothetical protein